MLFIIANILSISICFTLHSLDVVYLYPVPLIMYRHRLSYSHDCVYSLWFVNAVTGNQGQAGLLVW